MAALERLWILTAKFTVCVKLYAVNNEFISFSSFHRDNLCLCHHTLKIKISDYTRINSRPLLLIVHINDLPPTINTLPEPIFADDTSYNTKRTPHFTITNITWVMLLKINNGCLH
jgi:hypothetical protein